MQMTENQKLREALQALYDAHSPEAGQVDLKLALLDARQALALPTSAPVSDLPELPEPTWSTGLGVAFTSDQMRAYALAAMRKDNP